MSSITLMMERVTSIADFAAHKSFKGSLSDRIEAYELLADYMSAGTPLLQALQTFEKQAIKSGKSESDFKRIRLAEWINAIKQGKRFADAIDGWVPERERMQLEASESVGQLAMGLERAVTTCERGGDIRSIWVGAMAYPMFLGLMCGGVLHLYGGRVIPKFANMLSPEKWTGDAHTLYLLSALMFNYWPWFLAGFAIFVCGVIWSLPKLTGPVRAFLDKAPPYSFYKLDEGAAFMVSLTSMVEAGRPVLPAIEQIRETGSPWLNEKLEPVISAMKRGKSFGEALELGGHDFPDKRLISLIALHSGRKSFVSSLPKQVDRWINGRIKSMRKRGMFINQLSMGAVAAFAGWMYLAMADISTLVTSVAHAAR